VDAERGAHKSAPGCFVASVSEFQITAAAGTVRSDWGQSIVSGLTSTPRERDTTISKDANLITFINVLTVDPTSQSRLVELLIKATDRCVRHARGFISSSLHRSRDGTKVRMYAQWRSLVDYEAMRRDLGPVPYLEEALTIAKFEPGMYDVVESFAPPREEV
jgi:hypothetical protein